MYFCDLKDCSFFSESEHRLRSHTSRQHKCGFHSVQLRDERIMVEFPLSTKLSAEGLRMRVDRATNNCFASFSNKERSLVHEVGPVNENGTLESVLSVSKESCSTLSVDEFEELCSMFLSIAKKISERFCMELLKFYFKSRSFLTSFIDRFRNHGDIIQYWTNFNTGQSTRTSSRNELFNLSLDLRSSGFWKTRVR